LETTKAPGQCQETDVWDAMRLMARDLGYEVAESPPSWCGGRVSPSCSSRGRKARPAAGVARLSPADLTCLQVENDQLLRTCRDNVNALSRAGTVLGLEGWVVVSESSGALLQVTPMGDPQTRRSGRGTTALGPEAGWILSLAAAGPNPVGLCLDRSAVVLPPPWKEGRCWGRGCLCGLGIPLGEPEVPSGCLGVLLIGGSQAAAQALFGQALFSARTVDLGLALRRERSAHLQVAAGLAHEIRNPLTAVKGFLQLTLAHRNEMPEYAGVALRELDRAISLLEDYSLFSRAPRIEPSKVVNVDNLLSEATLVTRGLVAATPSISIAYDSPPEDLFVLADPPRLKQVFLNLCRNGVEAMSGGGRLTLKARRDDDEVAIDVSDTGVGIAPADLENIFEPFYTTKEGGTGLGLPVCRRIVESHGGRLTVSSRPGEGTTFRVHLPLHPQAGNGPGGHRTDS